MSQSSWEFEYDSVIRHKNRILNNYLNYSNDDILIKDDLVDFCIHCYHLYEWIKIGVGDEKIKKAVEKYVKSNEYLVLCGGIANHSKHFIVDKYWKGLYNKVIPLRIANSSQVSSSTGFSGDIEDSNINANLSLSIDIDCQVNLTTFYE